jgi:small subunit ribosomal protein S6
MRAYELMVIFDTDIDDVSVQQLIGRLNEIVVAGGGKVATTERWGRRRFAYEINKKQEGYYVVFEIVTEGLNLDDLDRFLRIADGVVRHKQLRLPDKEAAKRGLLGQPASA